MGKTFTCELDGCGETFNRARDLGKHLVVHKDASKQIRCEWPGCKYFTLDSKYLRVHFAIHTGEKDRKCPDKIKTVDPSGQIHEEECEFKTNDPSVLTKHRKCKHGYIPQPRGRRKTTGDIQFVLYTTPPSPRIRKPRKPQEQRDPVRPSKSSRVAVNGIGDAQCTTPTSSPPSALQQCPNELGQDNVEPPQATVLSSSSSLLTIPIVLCDKTVPVPTNVEYTDTIYSANGTMVASEAYAHAPYGEPPTVTRSPQTTASTSVDSPVTTAFVPYGNARPAQTNAGYTGAVYSCATPDNHEQVAHTESPPTTGSYAGSMSTQGYYATNFDWPMDHAQGSTAPYTESYNASSPEIQSFGTGSSGMYFPHGYPTIYYESQDAYQWANFYDPYST